MSGLVRGYTGPMVRQYGRFVNSSTMFLMSADRRRDIAESLRFCRRHYGAVEARRYRAGLLWVGCVFPIERRRLWARLEAI